MGWEVKFALLTDFNIQHSQQHLKPLERCGGSGLPTDIWFGSAEREIQAARARGIQSVIAVGL